MAQISREMVGGKMNCPVGNDILKLTFLRIARVLVFLCLGNQCFSQTNAFYVDPSHIDTGYADDEDSHLVVRNSEIDNGKLFLFIGGTGSSTKNYLRIAEFAADLGYDVMVVSYLNDVAAASLKNDPDSSVFRNYRQEICFGSPLSPYVDVDTFNSINSRTIKLLQFLDLTYPSHSWKQYFLDASTVDWSKIILAGHSQGAGHAAYFAKFKAVDRVLMFSGPNDFSDYFSSPAEWLATSGSTPLDRHFSYLSLHDEVVDFRKQLLNIEVLGLYPSYDTVHVEGAVAPYDHSHCLFTTQRPGLSLLFHNTTVRFSLTNDAVWEYMFTSDLTVDVHEPVTANEAIVYPNPTDSKVLVQFDHVRHDEQYVVQDINGRTVLKGRMENASAHMVDLSPFPNGIYLICIGGQTFRIMKDGL